MEPNNDKKNDTALLVMDVQRPIVKLLNDGDLFFQSLAKAMDAARDNGIPVLYIVLGFRAGYPDLSPNNKSAARIKSSGMNLDGEEASRVHPAVAPRPGDFVITKKRVSAFSGSDLEVVLRSLGVTKLVLSGIATSGVVLSTLREAADKDYVLTVLSDCCGDADAEVHRVLTTKIFPRQAEVMTAEEWRAQNASPETKK